MPILKDKGCKATALRNIEYITQPDKVIDSAGKNGLRRSICRVLVTQHLNNFIESSSSLTSSTTKTKVITRTNITT